MKDSKKANLSRYIPSRHRGEVNVYLPLRTLDGSGGMEWVINATFRPLYPGEGEPSPIA
jgi:hypothetical protein